MFGEAAIEGNLSGGMDGVGLSGVDLVCGFRLRLCRRYWACTKGKVDRLIRYLRGSF